MEVNTIDFYSEAQWLREVGALAENERVTLQVQGARQMLQDGLNMFIGKEATWLPEYDAITAWLTDNDGRGLLCAGNVGRGKTILCGSVLPCIIHHRTNKIVRAFTARELATQLDDALRCKLLFIDDIGTERETVIFGNRIDAVPTIVDEAERRGKLLLLTTNLTHDELKAKYGERTTDRLCHICKAVVFQGASLRRRGSQ